MKKIIFPLFLAAPLGLLAQTSFRITGRLKNQEATEVYLLYMENRQQVIDSAKVVAGAYVLTGKALESQPAELLDINPMVARPTEKDRAEIFLSGGSFSVTHIDSFSNVVITGSEANTEYSSLQKAVKPLDKKEMALLPSYRAAQAAGDDKTAKAIFGQAKGIDSIMGDQYLACAGSHPHSPIALYALEEYAHSNLDAALLQPLFDRLDAGLRHSTAGKTFQERLTIAAKTSIGREAMDFTQPDTLGNPVTLSSFRGKYVLLDFWASWCGPCRAENPNVVSAYARYHALGFDILSVSLDRPGDKAKWLSAIHADGLTWTHVSDLQFWNNAVAKEYGINSIPQNFLLDPQGKIIAKSLRGDELVKKLNEIYKD
jgi:peroxiredoxin